MTLEAFFTKLNQNIKSTEDALRSQLSQKVEGLINQLENVSTAELRDELENLVDEVLSQFTAAYQDFISYIELELPALPKPQTTSKPRKQKEKKEPNQNEFVRPTYVHRAFNGDGLRVSKDARPILMEFLNKQIEKDIEKIKAQLPTFQKGENEGEKRRITIKPDDLSTEKLSAEPLVQSSESTFERELETIPLDLNGHNYKLAILLKQDQ